MIKQLSKLWGKCCCEIVLVGLVMLIWGRLLVILGNLKLGISLWESRALWVILLGFRLIFYFVKSLS